MVRRSPAALLFALAVWAAASPPAALAAAYVPGELLVRFRPGLPAADRASVESAVRARPLGRFSLIDVEHLRLDEGTTVEQALAALVGDPRVQYAEPNYVVHADLVPNDPRFPEMWALQNTGQSGGTPGADIRAVEAWDKQTGDRDMLILGLMDTGVDYNHPDLANNIWTNGDELVGLTGDDDDLNGYVDDIHGVNFRNTRLPPLDDGGHGTLMCGVLAAEGGNGLGVTGVAWRARVVVLKILSAALEGTVADAIRAIDYSVMVGARLNCCAWGTDAYSLALRDAINAAGEAGQLFVAAAGNLGRDIDAQPYYPASYDLPCIISVAATDDRDSLATFSNFGPDAVDIAAPGVGVLSTEPNGRYLIQSGTSLAAAHVAGTCALVMVEFPGYTNLQVKDQVVGAADPKPWLAARVGSGGRLNAARAVAGPDRVPPGAITDLTAVDPGATSIGLRWTATGDDGPVGRATRYDIRVSTESITEANFGGARAVPGPVPARAGTPDSAEVTGLAFSSTYYFAIKVVDDYANIGPISNVAAGTTLGPPRIAIAPASFSTSLVTGAIRTQALTVFNEGEGALDFRVTRPQLLAPPAAASPAPPPAGSGPDTRRGDPLLVDAGGPDAYGYSWSDSDERGGPRFGWVDVTGVGALLPLTGDDRVSAPVSMGMEFPFYGAVFDSVRICTNGYLSFTSRDSTPAYAWLPNPTAPTNLIAPFWSDLDFGFTRHVYTHNDGNRFIVSWTAVPHYYLGGPYTFQALLYPSGEMRFQYLSMQPPLDGGAVGIQNANRDAGLTVILNAPYIHDSLAVRIRALPPWLTVSPDSGRIAGGQHGVLTVRFDAAGLSTDFFDASFAIESNDPDQGRISVPARLHAVSAPDIAVTPATVSFDSVAVGVTRRRSITVSNTGVLDLVVSDITSDRAGFTASPARFSVHPGLAQGVELSFAPAAAGVVQANFTLWSNDPDGPARPVQASGTGYIGPTLGVEPESLAVELPTNGVTSRPLRISNPGNTELRLIATAVIPAAPPAAATRPRAAPLSAPEAETWRMAKGEADGVHGPEPLRAGGPDGFGYTYVDSDEPGGPVFEWVDLRPTGTLIPMAGDDSNSGPYPIGFSFPFYGAFFDSFRVCTNGFISFTSSDSAFANTALPNSGGHVPENLLAVLWDDYTFGGIPRAYYHADSARLVVQFQDVPRLGETALNTFEAILYPDGRIIHQYLAINTTVRNSSTIGIQNAARDKGLQVAFNANYVKNDLAVRFRPPLRFLSVAPEQASVPPRGNLDLTVGFYALGLPIGHYQGMIHITSNDEVHPARDIPCRLSVRLAPDIAVAPAALDFGSVVAGRIETRELRVTNLGSDLLEVTSVQVSDPAYAASASAFSLPPGGEDTLRVIFSPSAVQAYPATLTLVSNDPDSPNRAVPITGEGALPSAVHVAPSVIATALATTLTPEARTRSRPLVIENRGGSGLRWEARAIESGAPGAAVAPQAASGPLEVEAAKGDPGAPGLPVTEASGGPDAFGYRWDDSDEPGGPAFGWVDISAIGARIPFSRDDQNVGPIPLPFSFPFYRGAFDSMRVCSNGWLSFTSRDSTYHNVSLPNAAARSPANLVAPFWDDLDFGAGGAAYYDYDGSRVIVSFVDAPRWVQSGVPTGRYTFQALLYPDGEIDLQYLDVQGVLNSATIGIQNAARDVGLQVAYNTVYVHAGLRVRFLRQVRWLSVSADSGVTAAGGRDTLDVRLDAGNLTDGEYAGVIEITSNDPATPLVEVPVTAHVGVGVGGFDLDPEYHYDNPPTGWIAGRIVPPAGCEPQAIVPASVRALGSVPVAPGSPVGIAGCGAVFDFERLALLSLPGSGAVAPVEVMAELADVTWFIARDTLSMLRPLLDRPAAPYVGGTEVPLTWTDAPGSPPSRYDLWYSSDGGRSWAQVALGEPGQTYAWMVPRVVTGEGWLELVAHANADGAYVGSAFAGPFAVLAGTTGLGAGAAPERFGLGFAGSNPARGRARFELTVAERSRVQVRVYDVRGRLVRKLAEGEFEPQRYPLVWDGADDAGHPVGAGIYFAHATARGSAATARFALIR
jgi:hypothetical protein